MTGRGRIIFKVIFVFAILSYSFWHQVKLWFDIQIFYPTIALCFSGYTFVIYEFVRIGYKEDKKLSRMLTWAEIIFMSTVSSVLDEMFFDPTKLEANEYISFVIIIIIEIYNEYRRKRENRTN